MSVSLADRIGLGDRELIAVVGAGGKTTTVKALSKELADRGSRVVVTTTTKMGRNQVGADAICSNDPDEIARAVESRSPLFVACDLADHKVTGPNPDQVDALFGHHGIDHLVVEADGARKMLIKAPAEHEPQIPRLSTVVIVVASALALGEPIQEVAHRPEVVAHLVGTTPDDSLTEDHVAQILASDDGGLRGIPKTAIRIAALPFAPSSLIATIESTGAFDRVIALDLTRDNQVLPHDCGGDVSEG